MCGLVLSPVLKFTLNDWKMQLEGKSNMDLIPPAGLYSQGPQSKLPLRSLSLEALQPARGLRCLCLPQSPPSSSGPSTSHRYSTVELSYSTFGSSSARFSSRSSKPSFLLSFSFAEASALQSLSTVRGFWRSCWQASPCRVVLGVSSEARKPLQRLQHWPAWKNRWGCPCA